MNNDVTPTGVPPIPPIVLFVGEAPGKREVEERRPFAGASGELLRQLLSEFGLLQHAVYTNAVLCQPPDDLRNQEKWWNVEQVQCYHLLQNRIRHNPPKVIVALGRAAIAHILGKNKQVALGRRIEVEFLVEENGHIVPRKIPVFTTYNPAFLLRNPDPKYLNAFKRVLSLVRVEIQKYKSDSTNLVSQGVFPVVQQNHNAELQTFLDSLLHREEHPKVVIDIEVGCARRGSDFDGKSFDGIVVLVGVGDGHGVYYKPFLLYDPDARQPILPLSEFTALRDLLLDNRFVKIMHNASFEIMWFLRAFGVYPPPLSFVDTMLLAHALDENKPSYSLASLVDEYVPNNAFLNWKNWVDAYREGSGLNACFVPTAELVAYNRADVVLTAMLFSKLEEQLKSLPPSLQRMLKYFIVQVLNPIAIVVAHMSATGIPVSLDSEREVLNMLKVAELELVEKLRAAAPQVTNFNSTPQLVQFLLSKGVTELEEFKTSKGNYSLTKEVIDKLCEMRPDVEFLRLLKDYREVVKCESTFLRKIPQWVDETTGRIYPNIHITGTKTGRLSTSNPPLQNYPSEKKSIGKIIRKIFKAPEGYSFVVCDAKQHELRILAIKSGDENLRNAFLTGEDVHKVNAARILNKPLEDITEVERNIGKKFSFAAIYGVTEQGAARIFNLPDEESKALLRQMYTAFPQAMSYLDSVRKKVLRYPYLVHTWLGRCRRPLWGVPTKSLREDSPAVERAKRQAGNFVIQAEASDLWCLIAYQIFQEFHNRGWDKFDENGTPQANIALLIHDSIIIVCKNELLNEVLDLIKRSMAIVSYLFHTEDLPITGEYAVYGSSLGDEPVFEGEWSVHDIVEEIERWLAGCAPPRRFKLFREDYLNELYKEEGVNYGEQQLLERIQR